MTITERYINTVHYIISANKGPNVLGITKINKILFFVDGFLFNRNGRTLTGDTYIKRKRSTTAKHISQVRSKLIADKKIAACKDTKPHSFTSLKRPNISCFSLYELDVLSIISSYVCNDYTIKELNEIMHNKYFDSITVGSEIDLYNYFVAKGKELLDDDSAATKTLRARASHK